MASIKVSTPVKNNLAEDFITTEKVNRRKGLTDNKRFIDKFLQDVDIHFYQLIDLTDHFRYRPP